MSIKENTPHYLFPLSHKFIRLPSSHKLYCAHLTMHLNFEVHQLCWEWFGLQHTQSTKSETVGPFISFATMQQLPMLSIILNFWWQFSLVGNHRKNQLEKKLLSTIAIVRCGCVIAFQLICWFVFCSFVFSDKKRRAARYFEKLCWLKSYLYCYFQDFFLGDVIIDGLFYFLIKYKTKQICTIMHHASCTHATTIHNPQPTTDIIAPIKDLCFLSRHTALRHVSSASQFLLYGKQVLLVRRKNPVAGQSTGHVEVHLAMYSEYGAVIYRWIGSLREVIVCDKKQEVCFCVFRGNCICCF